MIQLTVMYRYRNNALGLLYEQGETVSVSDELADFLRRDAPECFALSAPPQNRAIDAPPVKMAIDTSDGVDKREASFAGRVLGQSKKKR